MSNFLFGLSVCCASSNFMFGALSGAGFLSVSIAANLFAVASLTALMFGILAIMAEDA